MLRRLAKAAHWQMQETVRRHSTRAGILMYHRVADEPVDPWGLCVRPGSFDEHMSAIARKRAAVDLSAFVGDGAAYDKKGRHVAVTFDDGYIDNLKAALPILEKHEIPATIFITSYAVGRRREFWWDGLERAVLQSPALPAELHIRLGSDEHHFVLRDTAEDAEAVRQWRADDRDPGSDREQLYLDLWNLIVELETPDQDAAIDAILAWAGMPVEPPASRLPVTEEEFAQLAGHPLIHIGSHTRHHRMLTKLDSAIQREEIFRGHREIEEMAGGPIDRFSYPFGRFNPTARQHVEALGLNIGCTSEYANALPSGDTLQLPRISVVERDGESFMRWLGEQFGLLKG